MAYTALDGTERYYSAQGFEFLICCGQIFGEGFSTDQYQSWLAWQQVKLSANSKSPKLFKDCEDQSFVLKTLNWDIAECIE